MYRVCLVRIPYYCNLDKSAEICCRTIFPNVVIVLVLRIVKPVFAIAIPGFAIAIPCFAIVKPGFAIAIPDFAN